MSLVRNVRVRIGAPWRLSISLLSAAIVLFASLEAPPDYAQAQGTAWDGVPTHPLNFGTDVETWWASHPFNPESAQYRPNIASPSPAVNAATQYGGNIQAAIDALPATGGTVNIPAGTYNSDFNLIGKSNVHLISDGGAVIRSSRYHAIAGCTQALDYATFARDSVGGEPVQRACATTQRIRNIYIKGLTFDGNASSHEAFLIRAARDVVMDNVTFQNYADPGSGHAGLISGAAMLDNVWVRNSRFAGRAQYALYLDGLHGGGVIGSRFDAGFGSGNLLYLTNDDFSRDWNQNGQISLDEQRMSQYVVAYGNSFAGGRYDVFGGTGRNMLVTNNTIDSRITTVASFETKSSYTGASLTYQKFSNRVVNNTVARADTFGEFYGPPACPLVNNCAQFGQYSIRGNRVVDPANYVGPARAFPSSYGALQGPNTATGNCTGASGCGATGSATPPPAATSTPATSATRTPTPAAATPTAAPTPGGIARQFPLGVFEDGNMIFGEVPAFTALLDDLAAHSLDAIFFGNNATARDEPLLNIADQRGVGVVFAPHQELNAQWWENPTAATLANAQAILNPIVDRLKNHPSLLGYNLVDEPGLDLQTKLNLAVQAVATRDPAHPSAPVLIAINTADALFNSARPGVFVADVYPIGADNAPCDFTMRGFGYLNEDFSSYIRRITATKPSSTPLWLILQTHKFGPGGTYSLRQPSVPEVRAQHWMGLGEGATGIFWFIYSSQQGWTGLADNPTLFTEVGDLARRTGPLRQTLLNADRVTNIFTVTGGTAPYVSTLQGADGKRYAVVVNKGSCSANQSLSITAAGLAGSLRDLETGQSFTLGSPISFRPGDGKIFELVSQPGGPTPTPDAGGLTVTWDSQPNGIVNGQVPSGEMDWGANQWRVNPAYGPFPTRNLGFASQSITSATIQMLRPRALQRLQIYAEPSFTSTVTLSCAGNPTRTVTVPAGQNQTYSTGWTAPCASITIAASSGWNTSFDTLEFGPAGGGPAPTSTAPPATSTPTRTATAPAATATPAPPTATAGPASLVLTWDSQANGIFSGQVPAGEIDWGTNLWRVNPAAGPFPTRNLTFRGQGITSATIQMLRPRALQRLQIYAEPSFTSTVTLTCPGNPTRTVTVPAGQNQTYSTGWTAPCASITIAASSGWSTVFDTLEFGPAGGAAPTATSPAGATATRTATPVAPTATAGAANLTLTWDTQPNGIMNGQVPAGEINWGNNQWRVNPAYGAWTTRNLSFATQSIGSATIQMLRPRALQRLQIYAEPNRPSTVTLSCAGNPTQTLSVGAGQVLTHSTGWTAKCSTITVTSSTGWSASFDNLEFGAP